MGVSWYACCLYFTDLGDLGTILGRSLDIRERRSRLGLYRILADLDGLFRECFGYLWTKKDIFFIIISRLLFLMIFGSESGCPGLENQAFGKGGIAKINFCRNWISDDSRVDFL